MLSREKNMTRRGQHGALAREVPVTVQDAVAVEEAIIAEAAALAPFEVAVHIRSLVLDPIVVLAQVLALVPTRDVVEGNLAPVLAAIRLARVAAGGRSTRHADQSGW